MVAWPPTYHQKWLEPTLAADGAHPRIVFRSTGHDTILSMVRAGIGSAVLPWLALRAADAWSDDLLSIPALRPSPNHELRLYWRAERIQSPPAAQAISLAIEAANDLDGHI